jgi:pimeloyl-ACP methyl ester carboxylesterase
VLVHGAGSGPYVFDGWPASFPGIELLAVDLQEGLDVARATHDDYASRVAAAADALDAPVALCGWSMGGLVVLQAAERVQPHAVVLLEASPPAEVQGATNVEPVDGTFDPEEAYGPFPQGMRPRLESLRARGERKRGISVPSLPCRSLVVHGDDFPNDRGRDLAAFYGGDVHAFPGFDHWDLVLRPEVPAAVSQWLGVDPGTRS